MKTNNVELCAIANGTSNNFIMISFINMLKESLPVIHACPYEGKLDVYNVSVDTSKIPSIFPSGIYRSRIRFYDDTDSNIYTVTTQ